MLFALARNEIRLAETAAALGMPYRPPDRWALAPLSVAAFHRRGVVPVSTIQQLNPGRAIVGLLRPGFVLRDADRQHRNLALTVQGFAEARRLGGVPDSDVDLDRLAADWRAPEDFGLGGHGMSFGRDDDADAIRRADRSDPDYLVHIRLAEMMAAGS
jgi:hypothetical protein